MRRGWFRLTRWHRFGSGVMRGARRGSARSRFIGGAEHLTTPPPRHRRESRSAAGGGKLSSLGTLETTLLASCRSARIPEQRNWQQMESASSFRDCVVGRGAAAIASSLSCVPELQRRRAPRSPRGQRAYSVTTTLALSAPSSAAMLLPVPASLGHLQAHRARRTQHEQRQHRRQIVEARRSHLGIWASQSAAPSELLLCRTCKQRFSREENHPTACRFHPAIWTGART